MSPTDLSQATPESVPSFPRRVGAGWSLEGGAAWARALESGHFAIPCPGPPCRFPRLPYPAPSLIPPLRGAGWLYEVQGPATSLEPARG